MQLTLQPFIFTLNITQPGTGLVLSQSFRQFTLVVGNNIAGFLPQAVAYARVSSFMNSPLVDF